MVKTTNTDYAPAEFVKLNHFSNDFKDIFSTFSGYHLYDYDFNIVFTFNSIMILLVFFFFSSLSSVSD